MPATWVYVLRSESEPHSYYTGLTTSLKDRLAAHNAGHCRYTASARPWKIDVAIGFADTERAIRFETYLKSGSGIAFANRHSGKQEAPSVRESAGRRLPVQMHAADADTRQERLYLEATAGFGPALERLAQAYVTDPDLRQDLLQEIHVALWRSLARF